MWNSVPRYSGFDIRSSNIGSFQTKRLSAKWTARFFRVEKLCFPLGAAGHFHSHCAHGHGHWHHWESGFKVHAAILGEGYGFVNRQAGCSHDNLARIN